MKGVVDIHCHMLPAIDDGAKTMEQALTMARMAVADGIHFTVVTPHHLNGAYRNRKADIVHAMRALQSEINRENIDLQLIPGSELHLVPELPDELNADTALTVADRGKAALVELPVHTVPVGTERLLNRLQAQGLIPVIAHPERNSQLRREPAMLAEWVDTGCLGQVTAQSCIGQFGNKVQAAARHMVESGMIHFVASDAHRDKRRIPRISAGRAAIAEWTSASVAGLLAETFPQALVQGDGVDTDRLDEALADLPRRSLWGQFKARLRQ